MAQRITRILLACLVGFAIGMSSAFAACPTGSQYENLVEVQDGDLLYRFGTDLQTYLPEMPVKLYLSVRNTGTTEQVIPNPALITPMQFWRVMPSGCIEFSENCLRRWPMWSPQWVFFFGVPIRLDPGECYEYKFNWNGTTPRGVRAEPGLYFAQGGFHSGGWPPIIHAPVGEIVVPFYIDAFAPETPTSVSQLKSRDW